jgi:hypothetical protein
MMLFALISLAVSPIQEAAAPSTARVYAAPAVRPFEPPSNFGRVTAEGDGDAGMLRRPLVAPVVVEAYRGSYEYARTGAESAYEDGVANAERAMDARMGPLDGLWRLRDATGRELMALSLMDQGETRPLEGAFRTADATATVGPLAVAERSPGALAIDLDGARLSLTASAAGWSGVLTRDGHDQAVTLGR